MCASRVRQFDILPYADGNFIVKRRPKSYEIYDDNRFSWNAGSIYEHSS